MWIVKQITGRTPKSGWRGYLLIGCVTVLALLLAGASWSAWQSSIERTAADERQDRTLEVLLATDQLRAATLQQIRGGRGYLLTGNPVFLSPHSDGLKDADRAREHLVRLIADNPDQLPRIRALETDLAHLKLTISAMIESMNDGRLDDALTMMRSGSDRDA
ncbi:MAG: CHASE3 domain-containing protein, partial [Erythrobacter sp.]